MDIYKLLNCGLFSSIHGRLGHLLDNISRTLVIVIHGGVLLCLGVGLDYDLLIVEVGHHVLEVTIRVIDPLEHIVVECRITGIAHDLFDGVHADLT